MREYYFLIQNTDGCNLNCNICYAKPKRMNENFNTMSEETFSLLKKNLIDYDNKAKEEYNFAFGGYCEPTIDKELWNRIDELRLVTNKANFGIHSNSLLAEKYINEIKKLDFYVTSILGGIYGKYSFENITGTSIQKQCERIKYIYDNFDKQMYVVLSLHEFTLKEVEEITSIFKDTTIKFNLNYINYSEKIKDTKSVLKEKYDIHCILNKKPNNLKFVFDAINVNDVNECFFLNHLTTIDINGNYCVCCLRGFNKICKNENMKDISIYNYVNGQTKLQCKKYLEQHQKVLLIDCSSCVLLNHFGENKC